MPYMYILECADGSFYTGSTKDLPRRLWQHQNGLGANHIPASRPLRWSDLLMKIAPVTNNSPT